MHIFNSFRRLEGGENYVERIHYVQVKLITYKACNNNTVDIVWTPAHQGILGNTMADYEAKQASKFSTTSNEKIILSDFLVDRKYKTLKLCQETWEKDNKGRHLYKIKHTVTLSPWFQKINIPRKAITSITRIGTGHSSLHLHRHRIGVIESPIV